jgi:small-conductance mechanosensitive channel
MRNFWFFLAVLMFPFAYGQESSDSDSVKIQPFELTSLTSAAEETDEALRKARETIEKNEDSFEINKRFFSTINKNQDLRADTVQEHLESYNLWALKDIDNDWSSYANELESIKKDFSKLSDSYQEALVKTTNYSDRWVLTKKLNPKDIPEPLMLRIDDMILNLENANTGLKDSLNVILTLFDNVAREHSSVLDVRQRIDAISNDKKLNVFAKDSPPLHVAFRGEDSNDNFAEQISGTFTSSYERTRNYIAENPGYAEIHITLFIILCLAFLYFKRIFHKNNSDTERFNKIAVFLINNPIFVGIVFAIFLGFWVYKDPPAYIGSNLLLLIVLGFIPLLRGIAEKRIQYMYYYVVLLYILNFTENFMTSYPFSQRIMILMQSVLVLVGMAYLVWKRKKVPDSDINTMRKVTRTMFPIYLILSVAAIYGNLVGSLFLARILTKTMVITITVAIILVLVYIIFSSLLKLLMVSNARNYVRLIDAQGQLIQRKVLFYLRIFFYWVWVKGFLSQIGLFSYIQESFETFMEIGQDFGDVYLSVGQVVNFIIILIIFSIIANIFKDLLSIEILPRMNLKKGIPMAAGLITRYTILVLGFLMAVSAAGIGLDKLGFILGALSVGIGFGLQSVVGNFVSGLILVFERPVRVDDVITSGTVEGTIVEIGIRASRIRDWDGAEVIVPNMELISQQVTNWTLSDSKRRRELFIKVEYGTDPNKVIEIIKAVIAEHDTVIKEPEPMVLFLGFKEFSADFRVLFWVTENMLSTTSSVSIGIYNALKAEGINIPIPKREILEKKDPFKKPAQKKLVKPKAKKEKDEKEGKKESKPD